MFLIRLLAQRSFNIRFLASFGKVLTDLLIAVIATLMAMKVNFQRG